VCDPGEVCDVGDCECFGDVCASNESCSAAFGQCRCGTNAACDSDETCNGTSCRCGANAACGVNETCNGTSCRCGGGAACAAGSQCNGTSCVCVEGAAGDTFCPGDEVCVAGACLDPDTSELACGDQRSVRNQ
jgi:hypothetical protein